MREFLKVNSPILVLIKLLKYLLVVLFKIIEVPDRKCQPLVQKISDIQWELNMLIENNLGSVDNNHIGIFFEILSEILLKEILIVNIVHKYLIWIRRKKRLQQYLQVFFWYHTLIRKWKNHDIQVSASL